MGIDLELHSTRPPRDWHKSRATLLRSAPDPRNALADALESLRRQGVPGRLPAVDPYGDTVMNDQEATAALHELPALRQRCTGIDHRTALDDLAALLKACAETPGSFLWFQGD
ncbi:hypothetical protein [Streptomyces sp. NPDC054756]